MYVVFKFKFIYLFFNIKFGYCIICYINGKLMELKNKY